MDIDDNPDRSSARLSDGEHRSDPRVVPPGMLVGICGPGFALVATDARVVTDAGEEVAIAPADKLSVLDDIGLVIGFAGPEEEQKAALARVPRQDQASLAEVAELAIGLAAAHTALVIERRAPLAAAAVVAARNHKGEPHCWFLGHAMAFSPIPRRYVVQAPKPSSAWMLERWWRPNISARGALRLAVAVITETAAQNPLVGGGVRAGLLDADGCASLEVDNAAGAWEIESRRLAELFD